MSGLAEVCISETGIVEGISKDFRTGRSAYTVCWITWKEV